MAELRTMRKQVLTANSFLTFATGQAFVELMHIWTHRRPFLRTFGLASVEVDKSLLVYICLLRIDRGAWSPWLKFEFGKAEFIDTGDDACPTHGW